MTNDKFEKHFPWSFSIVIKHLLTKGRMLRTLDIYLEADM